MHFPTRISQLRSENLVSVGPVGIKLSPEAQDIERGSFWEVLTMGGWCGSRNPGWHTSSRSGGAKMGQRGR